jgi:hypothetical protein
MGSREFGLKADKSEMRVEMNNVAKGGFATLD